MLTVLCLAAFPLSAAAAENVEVEIPVSVELSGETPSQEETYTVVLQAVDDAPMPAESTLKITGDGKAAFPAIRYSVPGIYCYTIVQQKGTNDRGHYDETVYYVKVTVTNGENGGLEAAVAAHTDAEMVSRKQDIVFSNSYDPVPTVQPTPAETTVTPAPARTPSQVKTGDTANYGMWLGILGAAGCTAVLLGIAGFRKRSISQSGGVE